MPYRIVVHFDLPAEKCSEIWLDRMHRILNFSEDLLCRFRDGDLASHQVQDNPTSKLVVDVRSHSKVRRAAAVVDEMLRRHFPDGIGRLEIEHDAPA